VGAALRLVLLTNEPLLDNMGINGEITMTNLKSATGIADDRLSAHHPNGAGNTTGMGDFLVVSLGRSKTNSSRLLIPHKVNGSTAFSGSYGSTDPTTAFFSFSGTTFTPGDTITIQIAVPFCGDFFREQIASRSANLTFTDNAGTAKVKSADYSASRNGTRLIDITLEVTNFGTEIRVQWVFDDGMNTDAENYNQALFFRTRDLETATPRIAAQGTAVGFEDSFDGISHDYSINSGGVNRSAADVLFDPSDQIDEANATWELYFRGSKRATTSGDPSFSVTEFTEAQGGDSWELHLIDSSGTFIDAVVWTWGGSQNPYANDGQTRSATFRDRQDDNQAPGPNNPVTLLE